MRIIHVNTCSGAPWHAVLEPAPWRRWVLGQCETLGRNVLPFQSTLRIRASSATVGARHASPVKYAFGVFSVNTLFMSRHEIIARNANYTRHNRAGEATPTKHIITCSGAPWHAVIEPRRMARVSLVSPM